MRHHDEDAPQDTTLARAKRKRLLCSEVETAAMGNKASHLTTETWRTCLGDDDQEEELMFGCVEDRAFLERLYREGQSKFFEGGDKVEPTTKRRVAGSLRRLHTSYPAPDAVPKSRFLTVCVDVRS